MTVQYRFGLDSEGATVDVRDLRRLSKCPIGPFECIGCGHPLIPHLGERKAKHFQHLEAQECSRETQLHALAKRVFADTYRTCLANRTSFNLIIPAVGRCNHFFEVTGLVCEKPATTTFDLTQIFDTVSVETGIGGFVADILLSQSSGKATMLVEMAVAHACTPEKIASGLRIAECHLSVEDDVQMFSSRSMDATKSNVTLHNCRRQVVNADRCGGKCGELVDEFRVYSSGKSILMPGRPIAAIEANPKQSSIVWRRFKFGGVDVPQVHRSRYRDFLYYAVADGAPVKNCYLCKHARDGDFSAIWCLQHRETQQANDAVSCEDYRPNRR